ncbi:hypothetical protein [Salinibius halmophilus]|uniref:hypothetical protein n=1 Tax=Salinibius halmophilus TaxID=1853216 RepID=UPI000E67533A|nr:hypothetical protein [Salinibius halmophilus]
MSKKQWLAGIALVPGVVLADVPSAAIEQYNALNEVMADRSYDMTMTITSKDEVTELVIRQEAGELPVLVSENGGAPSDDALEEFEPERLYGGGGNGFQLALPNSGYTLVASNGNVETYEFQPLLLNRGKEDNAGRYMSGDLDFNTDCQCITRVQMRNDESFRKLGFKIEALEDTRVFNADDWRPETFTSVFQGGALMLQVGATTEMRWDYR